MTIAKSRLCPCGEPLPIRSGKGRPSVYCPECRNSRDKERQTKSDARRTALADAFIAHATKRFNRLVVGSGPAQTFLCTLYHEVRNKPADVPEFVRQALTRGDYYNPNKPLNLAHCFGAYCRKYHGVRCSQIFKKRQTLDEERAVSDAHLQKMKTLGRDNIYHPGSYGAIEYLLVGFDDGTASTRSQDDSFEKIMRVGNITRKDRASKKILASAEDVIAHQTILRDEVIAEIERRFNRGIAGAQLICNALLAKGYHLEDIRNEMNTLWSEGIIKEDQFHQLFIDNSCMIY